MTYSDFLDEELAASLAADRAKTLFYRIASAIMVLLVAPLLIVQLITPAPEQIAAAPIGRYQVHFEGNSLAVVDTAEGSVTGCGVRVDPHGDAQLMCRDVPYNGTQRRRIEIEHSIDAALQEANSPIDVDGALGRIVSTAGGEDPAGEIAP